MKFVAIISCIIFGWGLSSLILTWLMRKEIEKESPNFKERAIVMMVIVWAIVTAYTYGCAKGRHEATEVMLVKQRQTLESWRLDLEKCFERCP